MYVLYHLSMIMSLSNGKYYHQYEPTTLAGDCELLIIVPMTVISVYR